MSYLKYISDEDFLKAVTKVIATIMKASQDADKDLHKNVVDPFSAFFDGITQSVTYDFWLGQEKVRQAQKKMQNAIGDFHQNILGSIPDWKNLGQGGGLDVVNDKLKIIAEVKNKFNTTKGNHKMAIYDDFKFRLNTPQYISYTGYYVEIIPKGKMKYNKPFTPSDNTSKVNRPENSKIRIIDGSSFYSLATGNEFALQELFEALPIVISDNFDFQISKEESRKYFSLFEKAFNVK